MLELEHGLIIAIVSAIVLAAISLFLRNRLREAVLGTLKRRGAEAALVLLDSRIPPLKQVEASQLGQQRERMAALALLGRYGQLERELAAHTGAISAVVPVKALGLLALAVRADDPRRAAARLGDLAAEVERDGGQMGVPVQKCTRALASLAGAIASGSRLEATVRVTIKQLCDAGGLTQLVIWQALRRSLAAAALDDQADVYASSVRALTSVFEDRSAG